jgi:DNA invertase Pin-like site-specific DNA recombinase
LCSEAVEKFFGATVDAKPTGLLIGYARVSTDDQELRLQLDALEKIGCHNIWQEKRSATRGKRPELEKALIDLRPGDTLVVWRLDRLVRNMRELYKLMDRIHDCGANFKSLTEQFDFTTPMGEFVLGILGLCAQLEAKTTAVRTAAGMAAMKARGASHGAPPKLTEAKAARMIAERKAGKKIAELAEKYGVSAATINNYMKRSRLKRRTKK